ncbi:hypothetical protein AGMMS49936_11930 [Endomicrobiia bacterium]|nr:hypothetical protein AGMMS49936_11930 [Endomicrobiia bacterium]
MAGFDFVVKARGEEFDEVDVGFDFVVKARGDNVNETVADVTVSMRSESTVMSRM